MKRYNVLWLEDEPETNPNFVIRAYSNGIDIIHVFTVQDFKRVLTEKIKIIDAIILDAHGVEESKEEIPSPESLFNAISFINEKKSEKKLSFFIYTAFIKEDDIESKQLRQTLRKNIIYTKGNDEKKLISDVKTAADEQDITQIKHNNEIFFNSIKEYDIEEQNLFIEILLSLKVETSRLDDKLYFTHIRIVLEQMFRKANKIGLLHDFCINKGKVNLTDSSLFLSGKNTYNSNGAHASISHFPNIISNSVYNILTITGAASHTTDPDYENNINIQDYRKSIKTPYLLYNLTFQLMDILIWFDEYIKQNPDPEENKKLWVKIDQTEQIDNNDVWIQGIVIKSDSKDYAFFQPKGATKDSENIYIQKSNVVKFNLTDGIEINAKSISFQDNNGDIKTQVKNIQLIKTT